MRTATFLPRITACCLIVVGTTLGCAFGDVNPKDPFKRKYSLSEAQHQYTQLVRWSEFTKASNYVHEDVKSDFVNNAPSLRELRFTDYETGPLDIDSETGAASIDVTYYAYRPTNPLEITITETQYWARDGITNNWKVKPRFEGLEELEGLNPDPVPVEPVAAPAAGH
jgi:hypothetical protein